MRFTKPLDEELLHEVFNKFDKIVTVEDGTVVGGFGSAVLEFMNENSYKADVRILGIPDRIVEHGTPKELHKECGYDAQRHCRNGKRVAWRKSKYFYFDWRVNYFTASVGRRNCRISKL
jgi:deoxyxylulose-5-phosphate synthase